MVQLELATIVAQLAKGVAPEAIVAALRPAGERELLKRAVIVRTFDRRLFDTVLSRDVGTADVPTFEDLVKSPDVEPLPRTDSVFQIRRGARKANWDAWWPEGAERTSIPEPLTRLLDRLVRYYRREKSPVDELAQLALVDQPAALALFQELYRSADERFDLAACQDLIDVLSDPDRAPFIGADISAARDERVAYLGARSMWSSAYYQTEAFFEPDGVREVYEELLAGKSFRVLNLHAPGGRGKTMQLRWLVARQLVPEIERDAGHAFGSGRIACAMLDFDFIDAVNATRYPWLVLLEAAAQLNDQLPRKWFTDLLNAGWAIPLLWRNPADPTRPEAASKRMRTEGPATGEAVIRGFWRNLNEATSERPVLLVLDTLEEVHLRPQGHLKALLELLGEMLGRCPGLRLILSGRHGVAEILGPAVGALPPMREMLVGPFSDEEAHRYLEEERGLVERRLRKAIVEKAGADLEERGCDPLVLSLLADEVQARPKLTPAEIARYPAEVIRLINRIVSRIQEPGVRWLLRYGVVPRSLTLAFVRDVMEPHLRQAMAGKRRFDAPERDELPTRLEPDVEHFPTDVLTSPGEPLDLDALWSSLWNYAGSTSWVYPDPYDHQVLRFRADVAVPMRGIVRRQRIFRRLHRDAAAYFERRAMEEPGQWERWTREAIYHHFQLEGPSAAPFWRRALKAAGRADLEGRAAIAAELLEPDYVDDQGEPRAWRDDQPIVDPRTLVEAHFEHACALSEVARSRGAAPDDQLWSSVEKGLAAVVRWQAELDRPVIPAAAIAYLRAGLALKEGLVAEAEKQLADAVRTTKKGPEAARLLTLLGDVELARGERGAPERYAQARTATPRSDRTELADLDLKLLISHLELDQLDDAGDAYRRALAATQLAPRRGEVRFLGSLVGLGAGRFTWAENTAATALEEGAGWEAWSPRILGALARLAPGDAYALAMAAEEGAGTATGGALDRTAQAASSRELTGISAGELMQFDRAFGALETARSFWQTQGDAEGVARCHARSAAFKLRGTGDVRTAEHHLREAKEILDSPSSPVLPPHSDAWLDVRLIHAELHRHLGAHSEAAVLSSSTIDRLREVHAPPRRMIPAAVAGLASADADDRAPLLDLLVAQCDLMTPASARIVALRALRDVHELSNDDTREALKRLRELVRLGSRSRLSASDRGVLHLTSAELERVSGNSAAAVRRLAMARTQLSQDATGFFLRDWWLAADRVGKAPDGASPSHDARAFVDEFADSPMLCVAFLVERLETLAEANIRAARQLLERAEALLTQVPEEETQWHARLLEARARLGPAGRRVGATRAAAIFQALGDGSRAGVAPREASTEAFSELEGKRARIALALGPDGIRVETLVPPGVGASPDRPESRVGLLLQQRAGARGRASSFELEDLWSAEPLAAAVELGALLFPPAALDTLRRGRTITEVRLELEDGRLNLLPWELARSTDTATPLALEPALGTITRAKSKDAVARDEARFVQIALNKLLDADLPVDGDFGPASDALLRRYQDKRGLEPDGIVREALLDSIQTDLEPGTGAHPLVIMAQASAFSQFEGQRGMIGLGVDTGRVYETNGFEVWRIENPSLDEIRAAVEHSLSEGRVPAVLHLSGGLRESGGAVAFTFVAGGWYSEALGGSRISDELPVTAVDDLLHAFPRDSFRPLVVLDADRPPGVTETIAQLFLRNAFAGDLFALGRTPALIATGLVDEAATDLYGPLVGMLASGRPVGHTCQGIRRALVDYAVDPTDLERTIPLLGTALFTHLPWLRPVIR